MTTKRAKNGTRTFRSSYEKQKHQIKELETQNYQLKMALADQVEKSEIIAKANNVLDGKIQELLEFEHAQRKLDTLCEMMVDITPNTISLEPVSKLNAVLKNLHNALIENKKLKEKADELDKIIKIILFDERIFKLINPTNQPSANLLRLIEAFGILDERNEYLEVKIKFIASLENEIEKFQQTIKTKNNELDKADTEIKLLTGLIIKGLNNG